jgi:hypothetical protein
MDGYRVDVYLSYEQFCSICISGVEVGNVWDAQSEAVRYISKFNKDVRPSMLQTVAESVYSTSPFTL